MEYSIRHTLSSEYILVIHAEGWNIYNIYIFGISGSNSLCVHVEGESVNTIMVIARVTRSIPGIYYGALLMLITTYTINNIMQKKNGLAILTLLLLLLLLL